jgi:hypothetical protein
MDFTSRERKLDTCLPTLSLLKQYSNGTPGKEQREYANHATSVLNFRRNL